MGDAGLLVAHSAATLFMVGLIWTIQIVHYPIFDRIEHSEFSEFASVHAGRISALLMVPWGVEVLTTVLLVAFPPEGVARWLPWTGLILMTGLIAITALVSAPLHARLGKGFDTDVHRVLVGTNWIRTALWSMRGGIAIIALWQFLEFRG